MDKNKKREREEKQISTIENNEEVEEDSDFDDEENLIEMDGKRLNLPRKSKYRMRAHCNPLSSVSIS
jgi:hypothetical protein